MTIGPDLLSCRSCVSRPQIHTMEKTEVLKLRIFCALHRPQGKLQIGYHLFVIGLSFTVGFFLNMFNLQRDASVSLTLTKYLDCLLAAILSGETVLQIWSSSYKPLYVGCLGKLHYLYEHLAYKTVDTLGIMTAVFFLAVLGPSGDFSPAASIGHLTQVFQVYRLTHQQLRLIVRTIHFKFGYIFSILLFATSIFLVLSRGVYLLEKGRNKKINNIYDATWLVFVTIICIGFGDRGPVTTEGKLCLIFGAFFGLVSFSVMISLIGAQLANEREKASITSLIPAAAIVQNLWILHSMKLDLFWKYLPEGLTIQDKQAIICLQKIKCLVSSRHFKVSQSDPTQFDEQVLLYEHLLNRLDFIEKNIIHNSYCLHAINAEMDAIVSEIEHKL